MAARGGNGPFPSSPPPPPWRLTRPAIGLLIAAVLGLMAKGLGVCDNRQRMLGSGSPHKQQLPPPAQPQPQLPASAPVVCWGHDCHQPYRHQQHGQIRSHSHSHSQGHAPSHRDPDQNHRRNHNHHQHRHRPRHHQQQQQQQRQQQCRPNQSPQTHPNHQTPGLAPGERLSPQRQRQRRQQEEAEERARSRAALQLRGGASEEQTKRETYEKQRAHKIKVVKAKEEARRKKKAAVASIDHIRSKIGLGIVDEDERQRVWTNSTQFKKFHGQAQTLELKALKRSKKISANKQKDIVMDMGTYAFTRDGEERRVMEKRREDTVARHEEILKERDEELVNISARSKFRKLQKIEKGERRTEAQAKDELYQDVLDALRGATLKERHAYNDSRRMSVLMPEALHSSEVFSKKDFHKTERRETRFLKLTDEEKRAIHTRNTWWAWSQKHRDKKRFRNLREMAIEGKHGEAREEAAKRYHFVDRERTPRRTVRFWERWLQGWDEMSVGQRRCILRVPGVPWNFTEVELRRIANSEWDTLGVEKRAVLKRMKWRMKCVKNNVNRLWEELSEPQLARFLYGRHKAGMFDLRTTQQMLVKTSMEQLEEWQRRMIYHYFCTTRDGTNLLKLGHEEYVARSPALSSQDKADYETILYTDTAAMDLEEGEFDGEPSSNKTTAQGQKSSGGPLPKYPSVVDEEESDIGDYQ